MDNDSRKKTKKDSEEEYAEIDSLSLYLSRRKKELGEPDMTTRERAEIADMLLPKEEKTETKEALQSEEDCE